MHPIQLSALILTIVLPPVFFAMHRWVLSPGQELWTRRILAVALILLEAGIVVAKFAAGSATLAESLPMQLCDWAFVAVAAGLWFRSQTAFEVGYFWAIAGTFQALLTPAIDLTLAWWRLCGFFYSHALIVIGVLHLLMVERMRPRPRSLLHVFAWSEIYLAAALLTNALTDGNYGFLSHRPTQSTPLDYFSDTRWLYIVQLNVFALVCFAVLYLPWLLVDIIRRRPRGTIASGI
jgi:hypothetical integral membrane protein (TIGR02206 family)